jgi:integrase
MIPSRSVAEVVGRWHSHTVAPEAAHFAREVVARAAPASPARAKALLFAASRVASFAVTAGLELRAEVIFCPAVIERFIVANGRTFSAPTARTLRTNCRALGRALAAYPEPAPVRLPRERAKKPYTAEEISAYLALADAQPTSARAMRTTAVICLGAGAGLVGAELSAVGGPDVVCRSGGVVVDVKGRHPRAVPVLWRYGARLRASAAFAGPGYLVGGTERSRRNVASGLVASLCGGTDLPRLDQARLRATWLSELAQAIGLGAFMAATGVDCSQRLGDIAAGVAALDEAETIRLLGGTS